MNERDLLAALARAIQDGRVTVDLDCARLLHTDSPIAVQADHNRWLYGVVAAAIAVGALWRWEGGLAALALGIVVYFTFGRPWIHRRMRARFFNSAVLETGEFKKLWRLRGVTLNLAGAAPPVACASPDGDWRRFALTCLMPPAAVLAGTV